MSSALFVSTLIAPTGALLSPEQIATVAQNITAFGGVIQNTNILSAGRATDIFFVDEVGVNRGGVAGALDIITQPVANRRKRILIADMESTIIEQEMLDELAAEIGIGEKVADITRRAMNGELDFAAALTERVGLLSGQPQELLERLAARMTIMSGARELISSFKQSGGVCWLVSGGFTCFVKIIAEQLGFDRFYANDLIVEAGRITGHVQLPILDKTSKKRLLEQACAEYGCILSETIAIGDGANDIPMLQASHEAGGLGIAYHAKPKVRERIPNQINHNDLSALIYVLG